VVPASGQGGRRMRRHHGGQGRTRGPDARPPLASGPPGLQERRRRRERLQDLHGDMVCDVAGEATLGWEWPRAAAHGQELLAAGGGNDGEPSGDAAEEEGGPTDRQHRGGGGSGARDGARDLAAAQPALLWLCRAGAGLLGVASALSKAIVKPPGSLLEETRFIFLRARDLPVICSILVLFAIFAGAFGAASLFDASLDKVPEENEEGDSKLFWVFKLVGVAYAVSVLDRMVDQESPLRSALLAGI